MWFHPLRFKQILWAKVPVSSCTVNAFSGFIWILLSQDHDDWGPKKRQTITETIDKLVIDPGTFRSFSLTLPTPWVSPKWVKTRRRLWAAYLGAWVMGLEFSAKILWSIPLIPPFQEGLFFGRWVFLDCFLMIGGMSLKAETLQV